MLTFPRDHFHNVKSEIVIFARFYREADRTAIHCNFPSL
jgi:hypothetical protein